jgi:hypothetical protein
MGPPSVGRPITNASQPLTTLVLQVLAHTVVLLLHAMQLHHFAILHPVRHPLPSATGVFASSLSGRRRSSGQISYPIAFAFTLCQRRRPRIPHLPRVRHTGDVHASPTVCRLLAVASTGGRETLHTATITEIALPLDRKPQTADADGAGCDRFRAVLGGRFLEDPLGVVCGVAACPACEA